MRMCNAFETHNPSQVYVHIILMPMERKTRFMYLASEPDDILHLLDGVLTPAFKAKCNNLGTGVSHIYPNLSIWITGRLQKYILLEANEKLK